MNKDTVLEDLQRDRKAADSERPPDCDRPPERRTVISDDDESLKSQDAEDVKPGSVIDAWCRF